MHLVTFCGKEGIMKTNIKKFIENYKLLKADNSEYVVYESRLLVDDLKVCICIETFIYDDLQIEKGNVYLLRRKSSRSYAIYEITGLWKYRGHDANLLTYKASINGLKGWNIPTKYRGCFKLVKFNQLTSFLYWEDE